MGEPPLRVRLDLTKLNITTHNFVWFPVARCALNAISDLKLDICRQFNLSLNNIQLFVDGGLMRDEDTVLLLRENDIVQVIYCQDHQGECSDHAVEQQESSRLKKKHKKRKNMITDDVQENEINLYELVDSKDNHVSPTPPKKKYKETKLPRQKSSCQKENPCVSDLQLEKEFGNRSLINCKEIGGKLSTSIQTIYENPIGESEQVSRLKHSFGNTSGTLTNDTPSTDVSQIDCIGMTVSSDSKAHGLDSSTLNVFDQESPTKKRSKRKRRRKRKLGLVQDLCFTTSSVLQQTPIMNTPLVSLSSKPLMHLKFSKTKDSSFGFATPALINEKTFSIPVHELETPDAKNYDSIDLTKTQKFSSCKETPDSDCEITYDSKSDTAIDETDVELKDSSFIEKSKLASANKSVSGQKINDLQHVKSNGITEHTESITTKQNYSQYEALNSLPSVGTIVAFKVLELSELYCPVVSEYKEGVISSIDSSTDAVTIDLLEEEIKRKEGKFENVYEDEDVKVDVVRQITINWVELIEPRRISKKTI